MRLEFEAADLRQADAAALPLARRFLYWLSFVTHCGFRASRIERLVDATPGLKERQQFFYRRDDSETPAAVITPKLSQTIALLNTSETQPVEVQQAVRWFANGVRSEILDDQFQCFFFAIEILAEFHKEPTRIPDQCPHCRGELFCRTCNKVPTHRPYAKQAIQQLLRAVLKSGADEAFTTLDAARNHVMHGRQVDEIQATLPLPFEEIVDRAGTIAWHCVMGSIKLPPGTHRPAFVYATNFVRNVLTIKVELTAGSRDPLDPLVGGPNVTIELIPSAPEPPSTT